MNSRQPFLGTIQQHAYQYLRDMILTGAYAGGQKINPAKVAEELDISRMPVREALRQLDSEGLITMRPNRGAIVTILTTSEVLEIFEIRGVLEGLAVRTALPSLTDEDIDDLDHRRRRMDRVREEPKLWISRHDEFHDHLCSRSGRPRLTQEIARMRASVQPYLQIYIAHHASPEMTGFEHDGLMDLVRQRDEARAEEYMRDHIMSAAHGVIDYLEKSGQERTAGPAPSGAAAA